MRKKTLIERINIKGNSITNEDVIRGELILDEGDPFTKLNLEKSISKIKSRNIFKNVNYKILQGTKKDLNIIEIEVEEKPTGEISAGAGIGTNGGSFLNNVTENNYLGEGKSVGFDLELDAETLSGTLNYTDPNYDFLEIQLTILFQVKKMINQTRVTKTQLHLPVSEPDLNNIKIYLLLLV